MQVVADLARAEREPRQRDASQIFRALAAAITILAFGLYLFRIEAKGIWWDESLSLHRASRDLGYILSNRIELPGSITTDLHPPLYFILLHGLVRVAGSSDLALRFPSAAFAALTVPVLYAIGTRLRGPRAGVLAASLGAASPFVLWYAQEARMYTMATFLAAASLYALWRATVEGQHAWGIAYALVAAAGLATHYLFAFVLFAEVLFLLMWAAHGLAGEHSGKRFATPQSRIILVGSVLIVVIVGALVSARALELFRERDAGRQYITLEEMATDALHVFAAGITIPREGMVLIDVAFAALFGAGVVSLWRRPPRPCMGRPGRWWGPAILIMFIALPLMGMWAYSRFVGPLYMGSRYIIMASPAFFLGLGLGIDALWQRKNVIGAMALAITLVTMGVSDYRYFYHPEYAAKEDHRAAARLLMAEGRPGDAILVTAPENIIAFTHYYDGPLAIYPVPSVSLAGRSDAARIEADLAAILAHGHDRLWLVQSRTMFSDPDELVMGWLDNNLLLLGRRTYPSVGSLVTVSSYLAKPPILPEPLPSAALGRFADRLALQKATVRYYTMGDEISDQLYALASQRYQDDRGAVPGRSMAISLSWLPLAPLERYKMSLRLVDTGGHVWAQSDEEPYMYLPSEQWPVGKTVQHEQGLRLPAGVPPGSYLLRLVVYRANDGEPLLWTPVSGGEPQPYVDLGYLPVSRGAHADVADVLPAHLRPAALPAAWGELELLAWEAAPAVVEDRLYLNLYWRARQTPRDDYWLVINWQDGEGRVWYSSAQPPAGTPYETSRWRQGDLFWGSLQIDLPEDAPPGRHTVHILLYSPAQHQYLWLKRGPVPWPGRDLQIAEITIK